MHHFNCQELLNIVHHAKIPIEAMPLTKISILNFRRNVGATTPVGRYPGEATPEGFHDMAGNVWEWM